MKYIGMSKVDKVRKPKVPSHPTAEKENDVKAKMAWGDSQQ